MLKAPWLALLLLIVLPNWTWAQAPEIPICHPACGPQEICVNTFTSKGAQCIPKPPEAPIKSFILPFDARTEAVCTHATGSGSHSALNAFYALDLATPYDQPAAIIRAAADGRAFVFVGKDGRLCPEPPGVPAKAEPSPCGDGWGNRIKILHRGGYFSYYVHLDHPLVKTGEWVHKGEPIGVEGWTGMAGHRHLHWSVQKLPGKTEAQWLEEIQTDVGQSVPFRFLAKQNGVIRRFHVESLHCAHANIGSAPASEQPRLWGVR